ncbi:LAMI_0D07294g1_1 [Lachancea mirantina]|uniref:LAMI_0D07294g1_1 n=1 Tax=Lachancea mirantina TaxID=1230905 RepID=A0A1G4JCB5_9SACH|nr:LAMI_0D07294g1_1 [Lachancea mirantina]
MRYKGNKAIERELKNIINAPQNANRCGECGAAFPTWCSLNLGVLLCGRCASVHRKIVGERGNGRVYSEVKSLSLDKWTVDEVEELDESGGNKKNKTVWNSANEPFPFDGDEDRSQVEKFIRDKYVLAKFRRDPIRPDELDNSRASSRTPSRLSNNASRSSLSRPPSSASSRALPRLTHRTVKDREIGKYASQLRRMRDLGFMDTDLVVEALCLARGDMNLALDILDADAKTSSSSRLSSRQNPPLPQRPSKTGPQPASFDGSEFTGSAPQPAVFDGTVQQYMDPQTGMIYVDENQYALALQQQNLQQQALQQQALQQQTLQQQAYQHALQQQEFQQQAYQPQFPSFSQQPQIDKGSLMSLYSQPTTYTSPVEVEPSNPQYQQILQAQHQQQLQQQLQQQQYQQQLQYQQTNSNASQGFQGYYY